MSLVASLHQRFAQASRRQALAAAVARLLPQGARTLDLGCGDGTLAELVLEARPDVRFVGVDPLARHCRLPFARCDGARLPFAAGAFDAVLLIDVVHHSACPGELLSEAGRVARTLVLIKDHLADRPGARALLGVMDWVGNARFGVSLPHHYWRKDEWSAAFDDLGWTVTGWNEQLGLYRPALRPVFEHGLHFMATLRPRRSDQEARSPDTTGTRHW